MEYLKVLNDIVNKYYKRFPLDSSQFINSNYAKNNSYAYLTVNYLKTEDLKNRLLCLVLPAKLNEIFIGKIHVRSNSYNGDPISKPEKIDVGLFNKIEVYILEYWVTINDIDKYNIYVTKNNEDIIPYYIPVKCISNNTNYETNFVILEPKDNKEVKAADVEENKDNKEVKAADVEENEDEYRGFGLFDEPKACNNKNDNTPSVEGKSACKENGASLLPSLITKLENIINRRKAIVSEINLLSEELDKVDNQLKKVGEII